MVHIILREEDKYYYFKGVNGLVLSVRSIEGISVVAAMLTCAHIHVHAL
jgi:hypothetical protein